MLLDWTASSLIDSVPGGATAVLTLAHTESTGFMAVRLQLGPRRPPPWDRAARADSYLSDNRMQGLYPMI